MLFTSGTRLPRSSKKVDIFCQSLGVIGGPPGPAFVVFGSGTSFESPSGALLPLLLSAASTDEISSILRGVLCVDGGSSGFIGICDAGC